MKRLFAVLCLCALAWTNAPAQSIVYDEVNRIVTVTGTDLDDECKISVDGDEFKIKLTYPEADNWNHTDNIKQKFEFDELVLVIFFGLRGDDICFFDDVDDFVDEGADHLVSVQYGGEGEDMLFGGPASDYLDGGDDNVVDVLFGGGSNDTFVRYYINKKVDADHGTLESAMQKPKFSAKKSFIRNAELESEPEVKVIKMPLVDKITDFNEAESDFIHWQLAQPE
ncbi:calcium-binding protein [Crateriforma conspicua]|uniref:calcium-binding protein n=1 Tax=Crateriforma conspicua TaxID=2527996 RepID=UPI001189FC72|nr:calcium-binding protein [Crateriforma conspicua]QDV64717.1 RTX-I toxin determinant A from serotypes 1/9 [Crateriforma conspicua]